MGSILKQVIYLACYSKNYVEDFFKLNNFVLENTRNPRSAYFYLYLASLFINSCYTLAWDIKMDWGFLDRNAGENRFLREEIVYPNKVRII